MHEVEQKHLTQVEAAQRLQRTDRQVRRMLIRMRDTAMEESFIDSAGGPRTASWPVSCRQLAKKGLLVSREILRKWMIQVALWTPRLRRLKKIHVSRERRASFGELVMQDSSPFRWLEERGPACQLIALLNDATSRIWARFTEHDTTEENLRTLQGWLRRYGRPEAFYGGTAYSRQCPSAVRARIPFERNPERTRGSQGERRSHGQLGGKPLGCASSRGLRRPSRSAGGNRTAAG